MHVGKLNEAVNVLKDNLGSGLIACDIFAVQDGQSIVGYNTQPKACALFTNVTNYLIDVLKESDFPRLGRYYIIDLEGGKLMVVIPLGAYLWGILADGTKVQMGLLLNVAIPNAVDAFEGAMAE